MHRAGSNHVLFFVVALCAFLSGTEAAFAQNQSLFGNRSSQGQGSNSLSGNSLFGPPSFSASSFSGDLRRSQSSGTLGNRSQSRLVGDDFIGRSDDTREFIGRRSERGGNRSSRNRNARGPNNRRRRGGNRNNSRNRSQQSRNRDNTAQRSGQARLRRIQIRHRIAFEHPVVPVASIKTKVESHFKSTDGGRAATKKIQTQVDEQGVLTLRGEVESLAAKELTELIARMEPGVRAVRNELTVPADAETE